MGFGTQARIGEQRIAGFKANREDRAGAAGLGIAPEHQVPVHGRGAHHGRIGHGLHQAPPREASHADRAHRARAHQHQVGVKQLVHRDAGVKQAVPEAQLHEHQDAGEGNARQCHRQSGRLAGEQQPGQGDAAPLPEAAHRIETLMAGSGRSA